MRVGLILIAISFQILFFNKRYSYRQPAIATYYVGVKTKKNGAAFSGETARLAIYK